jgi:acyl carrier protein
MSDTLKDELRQIIVEVTEVEDTPFADLGIDSMMAIEIVADVEKNYEITIAEDELADLTNLRAVYDKVQQKLSEAS